MPVLKSDFEKKWWTPEGAPNTTANEIYNDIMLAFHAKSKRRNLKPITLKFSPLEMVALQITNTFNVTVKGMLTGTFKEGSYVEFISHNGSFEVEVAESDLWLTENNYPELREDWDDEQNTLYELTWG